jgi:hypothetical protein
LKLIIFNKNEKHDKTLNTSKKNDGEENFQVKENQNDINQNTQPEIEKNLKAKTITNNFSEKTQTLLPYSSFLLAENKCSTPTNLRLAPNPNPKANDTCLEKSQVVITCIKSSILITGDEAYSTRPFDVNKKVKLFK